MYKPILTGVALLLAATVVLAQIYRWVDEDGVVHYSDQPHEGAEEIRLGEPPTISLPTPRRQRPAARTAPGAGAETSRTTGYTRLEIASPAAEETLWNIGGVLPVNLELEPPLQRNHQLRVYFDGTPQTVNSASFQIQEVYRGTHNLQAEVLDENGELLIRSEPIRFYVQQTSVINPPGG